MRKKFSKELAEYLESGSLEELADLVEVIYSVTVARGYTIDELRKIREEKRDERGAFEKKILLINTE